jgi:tetratricopeptide (TPR) repeat protein
MLTDRDRAIGHRLAGEWLLRAGEQDPTVLAEHFERGGEPLRAAEFYLRAAEQAMLGADLPAVIARAERGVACGAAGEALAGLHVLLMEALFWMNAQAQSYAHALAALELSAPGSLNHWRALAGALLCVSHADDRQAAHDLLRRVSPEELTLDPQLTYMAARILFALLWEGTPELARRYLERVEQDVAPIVGDDRLVAGWVENVRGLWCSQVERDPWGSLQRNHAAAEHFEALGDRLHLPMLWMVAALNESFLGAFQLAEQTIERVIATQHPLSFVSLTALTFRIIGLLERRRSAEALERAATLFQLASTGNDRSRMAQARLLLSEGRLLQGDLAAAEEEARAAGDPATLVPFLRSVQLSLLAEIRLRQGQAAEAVELAREALALERTTACLFVLRQEGIPVLLAEALHASGEVEAAREALREARAELLARADKIADPAYRRSFLEDIPAHARTLELSRAWLGE